MPIILCEASVLMRPDIGGSFSELQVFVWVAHQEVSQVDAGADPRGRPVEEEGSIDVEVVNSVVLIRREVKAELQVVRSANPLDVVAISVGVVDFRRRTLDTGTRGDARPVEIKLRRPCGLIIYDVDAE